MSLVTFGIYEIFWLVDTKKELNSKTNFHIPSIWLLILPVPVVIAGYVFMFMNTTTVNGTTQTSSGGAALGSLGLIFLGFIVGGAISIYWFFRYSQAVNQYTKGKMTTAVSFLLLYLINFIGVALIQDAYNNLQESPEGPAAGGPATPPAANPPAGSPNQPSAPAA